jgi:hypothetical protein
MRPLISIQKQRTRSVSIPTHTYYKAHKKYIREMIKGARVSEKAMAVLAYYTSVAAAIKAP